MADESGIAGRYKIEAELARGGMGFVCRALDTSRGRHVALKRMLQSTSENKRLLKLFQREYHTLVQLQHPRIIEVYDYGVDAEGAYYTMELLDGKDLRELAPLGYKEVCRHLRDIASSLALLHARRLVHRDLSARNVRLTSDGRAKLLDFGALTTFGNANDIVGTPPVVPPEALNGQPLDQRADLYAIGALAYWVLTGRHAYPAQTIQALPAVWKQGTPLPPSRYAPDVPRELDELVMALISMEPMVRPNSAAEVIERLNVIAGLPSEEVLDAGHSYLSNPKIVGRELGLDRLRRFLDRVTAGNGASLIVDGESGVGRTRLVEEIGVEAQLKGATVLRVDAEIQRGPYAVVRGFLSGLFTALPEAAVELGREHAPVLVGAFPELKQRFPDVAPEEASTDRSEQRVRIQGALSEWLASVAKRNPLVLVLDNAHAADEASLAMCAALPRSAPNRALGVLVTCRTGDEVDAPRTLEALRDGSVTVTLTGLGPTDTIALVRGLFGDVDNTGRLGQWLHQRTDGNPMQCLALATQLIAEGHVKYKDGAWVLPSELSRDLLPSGMEQVLERRVQGLSLAARAFAEAISIERGKLSLVHCSALASSDGDELFEWIDELVQKGVLTGVGEDYRFSQPALQKYLREHIVEAKKRELHQRAAEYLLSKPEADETSQIDAGWHLLHAGDESRGADLLARVGSGLVGTIEGLAAAAPGLEVALEVYERQGRSKWMQLAVLEALISAGWYVDRRYAMKYGERTLEMSMELSGLSLATKLAPILGGPLATKVGTLTAAVRHGAAKSRIEVERMKDFKKVFTPLIATLGIMIGIAANTFDPRRARRIFDRVGILAAFPEDHIVRVMYDYARYYTYATEGRLAEAHPIGLRVLDWFGTETARQFLTASGARALSGGAMTGIGLYSAMSGKKDALEWAQRLEELGLTFYRLMATQVRFVHHTTRGETALAATQRERLELNAIQGGTTWQTSILIPLLSGCVYSDTGEVVRLRQVAEEMERMSSDIASMTPMAQFFRASYHFWRGRSADALPLLQKLCGDWGPKTHSYWAFWRALYARALLAAQRPEEAMEECAKVANQVTAEDAEYGTVTLSLLVSLSLAEAACGKVDSAASRLDGLIAANEPHEVPLLLAELHEARARVAESARDAATFGRHLQMMSKWARQTENTALIAKWKRLEVEAQATFEGKHSVENVHTFSAMGTDYFSAIRTVLEQHAGMERARVALRLMLESANADRGYLYLGSPPNLKLAVQIPEDVPPSQDVGQRVASLAAAVHQATDFLDGTDRTGTAVGTGFGNAETHASEYMGDLTPQLLVVSDAGHTKVVGAVAFKMDSDRAERLSFELLETVAKSLLDVNTRSVTAPPESSGRIRTA